MARVRLRVDDLDSVTNPRRRLRDPATGGTIRLPLLRITTRVLVGRDDEAGRTAFRALIDTGAWITVIESSAWRLMDRLGQLERLELLPPTDGSPASGTTSIGGNVGTPVGYGRVWLSVVDPGAVWGGVIEAMPAVPVIAQLLHDPKAKLPTPVLLGLHAGVLSGRRLTRTPVDPPTTPRGDRQRDVGGYFRQHWWLQDE